MIRHGAWTILRRFVETEHERSSPRALPVGDPVVDGHGAGDGLAHWTNLCLLVRGVPQDALNACRIVLLEVRRDRNGDVVTRQEDYAQVPLQVDRREAARRLGVTVRELDRLVVLAHHIVGENLRRRDLSALARVGRRGGGLL